MTSCARRADPAFRHERDGPAGEQLAPNRPSLKLLAPYIVALSPLRFCGPLLPRAEYPGLVKAASHGFHAMLQSTSRNGRGSTATRVLHADKSSPCPQWRTELT